MKNKRVTVYVFHSALLLLMLLLSNHWIFPRPYTYPNGVFYNGVIDYEMILSLKNLACLSFAANSVIAFAAWFRTKAFFIIHLLLAELSFAYIITMLLI